MQISRHLLLSVIASFSACPAAMATGALTTETIVAEPTESATAERIGGYLKSLVAAREFSGVVMVTKGEDLLFAGAYGLADARSGQLNQLDSSFAIASLSKTFTSAAVALLAKQGKLSVDDKLSKFVPNFPQADQITIDHLLRHVSGVGELENHPDHEAVRTDAISLATQVDRIAEIPFKFSPGSDSSYGNSGYVILARVVEVASGSSFEQFLERELLAPLGLKSTAINWDEGETVTGHFPGKPPSMLEVKPRANHASHQIGASELRSTAGDLMKWLDAIAAREKVDMLAFRYPYGWGVREYFGHDAIEQSGITDGFISGMLLFPEEKLKLVLLGNVRAGFAQQKALKDIAGMVLGEDIAPPQLPALDLQSDRALAGLAGQYDFPGVGPIAIRPVGNLLEFEWVGFDLKSYLYPLANGHFWNRLDGAEISFENDVSGKATALIWSPGENQVAAPRIVESKQDLK